MSCSFLLWRLSVLSVTVRYFYVFVKATATPEIYTYCHTLSLHDALPIAALAAMVTGGVGDIPLPAGFRLDAYAQAGIVGTRRRDGFADGDRKSTRLNSRH